MKHNFWKRATTLILASVLILVLASYISIRYVLPISNGGPLPVLFFFLLVTVSFVAMGFTVLSTRRMLKEEKADDPLLDEGNGKSSQEEGSETLSLSDSICSLIQASNDAGRQENFYFFHVDYRKFKNINLYYGMEAGDELLRQTGEFIGKADACVLCERGPADQMLFVIREPISVRADAVREKIIKSFRIFLKREQRKYPKVSLAVWCGFAKIDDLDVSAAIERANVGRLRAKEKNLKDPVFVSEEELALYHKEQQKEREVLLAIERNRLTYHLQPQINVETGRMVSAELLARLFDQNGELIHPAEFIPILEENGMIVDFDLLLFERLCHDMRKRLNDGKSVIPVSVNLSKLHIHHPDSILMIRNTLIAYKLSPRYFCFEITETAQLDDAEKLVSFVEKLHEIGVSVSLDDFGAGDAGFHLIKDIAVDELKIDRTFLQGSPEQITRYTEILSVIILMAKKLNIRIVCEGVETACQLEWIKSLGIKLVQGFYYARPDVADRIYQTFL